MDVPGTATIRSTGLVRQSEGEPGALHNSMALGPRLLERLIRYAFEQLLSRPNGHQMQQFRGEMWREDRKINDMPDDDDSRN